MAGKPDWGCVCGGSSGKGRGGGVHPPMVPQEWGGYEFHEAGMAGY